MSELQITDYLPLIKVLFSDFMSAFTHTRAHTLLLLPLFVVLFFLTLWILILSLVYDPYSYVKALSYTVDQADYDALAKAIVK